MKKFKFGSLAKTVAFFLVATILCCSVAFAASGWQSITDDPDSGDAMGGGSTDNGESDENTNGSTDKDNPDNSTEDIPVTAPIPEYFDLITGLEISKDEYNSPSIAFTVDPDAPIYGLSSSSLTVEIPTEDGKTILLTYINKNRLPGKIGSITETRKYVNDLAASFGGILFSLGLDDSFEYETKNQHSIEDLSANIGYHYTEFNSFAYSNADLIRAYISNNNISPTMGIGTPIFNFSPYGKEAPKGTIRAEDIFITYSPERSTSFTYSKENNSYVLSKNGNIVKDLLNDSEIEYRNLLSLFADSVTYETETATQTVIDTDSQGRGYYCNGGYATEILWSRSDDGSLVITNTDGEIIEIDRGSSYVSVVKAAAHEGTKLS